MMKVFSELFITNLICANRMLHTVCLSLTSVIDVVQLKKAFYIF